MLKSMDLDRQIGEVEKDLNILEKKTHELSLSIEQRGGSDAEDFNQRMGERKALLDQKTELLEKRDGLREERQKAWDKEAEDVSIAQAQKVEIPSERWTDELKALRELVQTGGEGHQPITIMDYFKAAEEGRAVTGAAAEYNSHVFGSNRAGDFPIEFLLERDQFETFKPGDWDDMLKSEHRASITGANVNPGASVNYVSQLFAMSEAAFCGASFPAVGVGDHSYPIFSKPTNIADLARDAENAVAGGSLTINTATNRRIQGSMELNAEDENRIPNIGTGLVAHLRASIMEALDNYAVDQLVAGLTARTTTNGTTLADLATFLQIVGACVDGLRARNVGEVRGLLGSGTGSVFSIVSGEMVGTGGSHFWDLPRLTDPNFYRGSAHIAAATGGTQSALFIGTAAGLAAGRLQVPIWRRGSILRNPYEEDRRARVRYTVATFAAVEVTATDQHVLETIDVS